MDRLSDYGGIAGACGETETIRRAEPCPPGARRSPRRLIPPPRRLAATLLRGARAATLALLALAALALAAADNAAAQTETTLVSNKGQLLTWRDGRNPNATAFTTGGYTGGYRLTSVDLYVGTRLISAITPRVEIFENGADNRPGTRLATLTNPATITQGSFNTFSAPANTTLSAYTTYWLFVSNDGRTTGTGLKIGTADNARATDTAMGWSIGDAVFKFDTRYASWSTTKYRAVFSVKGTALGSPPTPDPTCAAPDLAGRERIWTGNLTVGAAAFGGSIVGYGFYRHASVGALDETTFNIGRNGYTLDSISVIDGGVLDGDLGFTLTSRLTAAEKDALRLHVCDTAYDFSAAVRNGSGYAWPGDLDWSTFRSRTLYLSLPAPPAPVAPSGLSAQSVSGKPGYLRLSWTTALVVGLPSIPTDYEARYRKTGAPDWATWSFRDYGTPGFDYPPTTHAAPRSGNDAPLIYYLDPNTEYEVQVRATNSYGESGWSNRVSATTAQATTANDDGTVDADNASGPAAAPSQPTVRRVENEPGLMVRWNAPRTALAGYILTGYDVEIEKERERDRRITTLRKSYLYKLAGESVTNLLIPGLELNTAYTVRVRAVLVATVITESDRYSPWSPDTSGTTAAGRAHEHDIQLSLEFPDGTRSTTVAPGVEVTYRVKATGIHDWAAVRARGGIGKANIRIWEPERHKFHFFRYSYYESTKGILERNFINQTGSSGYLEGKFTVPDEAGAGASGTIEIQLVRPESCRGSACTVGSVNESTNKLCIAVDRSGTIAHPCSSGQTQAVAPTVEGTPGLSASGSDGSWTPGETVEAIVTFSEAVTVDTSSGTPSITLTLGGTLEQSARYTRGSGSQSARVRLHAESRATGPTRRWESSRTASRSTEVRSRARRAGPMPIWAITARSSWARETAAQARGACGESRNDPDPRRASATCRRRMTEKSRSR